MEYTWKRIKDHNGKEITKTLYLFCLNICSELGKIECDSRLVRLEADPTTTFILQSMEQFKFCLKCDFPICHVGTLDIFDVFSNMRATSNYILITCNGKTARINIEL